MIKFGGRSGYDYKLVMKKPEWRHHYTASVGIPPSFNPSSLPVYVHRTEETQPKQYTELARGSLDLEALVRSIPPEVNLEVQPVDLSSSEFSGQEIIPLTSDLLELFSRKKLLINRDMLYQFQPKPIAQFNSSQVGIGFPYGDVGNPRMIIKADSSAYAIKFPAVQTMEEKFKNALGIEFLEDVDDIQEEGFEDDGELEENEDGDEEESSYGTF